MKKPKWIKDIKVLVWDLDGTLYNEIPEMKKQIHQNVINLISEAKSISLSEANELFWKMYSKVASSTQTLINCGVDKNKILSGYWYSDAQLKYLKKDQCLIKIFEQLKNLRHIINTNGNGSISRKKLKKLGLSLSTFEKIFTNADMFGVLKPDLLPFKEVLKYTGLKANNHLFIGDREATDLVPAKKVGMRTCLVWGKSKIADISLKTVYDVEGLLI